MQSSQKRQN